MVVRINYRESFGRVVGYAMKTDKRPEIVGGNLSARTPDGIIEEFGQLAGLNTRCKKPVAHLAFSLPPKESFTADQWAVFAQAVAKEYGFEQFVAIRHGDTHCDHIHVIGNRIGLDSKAVSTSNDRLRMRQLCQGIEKEMYLEKTATHSKKVRLNKDELEKADRLYRQGKERHPVPRKLLIAEQIKACAYRADSPEAFVVLCERQGISVQWRLDKDGKRTGVSFATDGLHFSGTRLGLPLKSLNRKIYCYGKTKYNDSRSGASRMGGGADGQPRRSPTATARRSTRLAPKLGAGTKQTEREYPLFAGGAGGTGSGARGYTREEKKIMSKATKGIFARVAATLLDCMNELDGDLTRPVSRSHYRNRGGFSL